MGSEVAISGLSTGAEVWKRKLLEGLIGNEDSCYYLSADKLRVVFWALSFLSKNIGINKLKWINLFIFGIVINFL